MRAAILGVLLLLPSPAAADPVPEFRARLRELDGKEAAYWDDFQSRFATALAAFVRPWERAHSEPDFPQDSTWDYAPFHALYGNFVALREARAEAAETLASTGDPGAAAAVLAEFLAFAKDADGAEAAFEERLSPRGHFMCDQRPGVLRHGLGREERRLLPALARCPGAAALLAEEWKRAETGDGRASVLRRVAVLDALGMTGDPGARTFLEKRAAEKGSSTIRIAAMEGLLRFGRDGTTALLPLLRDSCPVVRLALLQDLRAAAVPDPVWIAAVAEGYPADQGRLRAEHLRTLRALTRANIGDDPAAWKAWIKEHAPALGDGSFRRPDAALPADGGEPAPASSSFYGVRAETLRPVFLVDGSFALQLPAEAAVQATKNSSRWEHRPKARWMDPPPVHLGILQKEWRKTAKSFQEGTLFGMFGLHGIGEVDPFEDGRMVRPDTSTTKEAGEFLEKLGRAGWTGPFEGLREVMRAEGLDPAPGAADFPKPLADTVFLLHNGSPQGGRFVGAEPAVEAVARLNRFRRLTVHCIRIGNGKVEAEQTLQGIARDSGGSFVWQDKPPKE